MSTSLTVSDDGSVWNLHRAGVDEIPFALQDDGVAADISGDEVTFKVAGGPTVTMEADGRYPTGLVLRFTLEDIAAIPARGADFRIKNETTGQVYLDGKVFARGFA